MWTNASQSGPTHPTPLLGLNDVLIHSGQNLVVSPAFEPSDATGEEERRPDLATPSSCDPGHGQVVTSCVSAVRT